MALKYSPNLIQNINPINYNEILDSVATDIDNELYDLNKVKDSLINSITDVATPAVFKQPIYNTPEVMPSVATKSNKTSNTKQYSIPIPKTDVVGGLGKPSVATPKVTYGIYNKLTGKRGSKATRNNNPGNITGIGGKLLYGAIGFAKSNTGDRGDRMQLVFATPKDGFVAMHKLALNKYSSAPIKVAFKKWQTDMKSFRNKLISLKKAGIDINKTYASLSPNEQKKFREIWSRYEGYRGKVY